MGEGRGVYRFLVGKPEEKRPHGRPRHRWEDNIRMDLQEMGGTAWAGMVCHRIGQGADCCKSDNEPSISLKCGVFLD